MAYANEVKRHTLNVSSDLLEQHGTVSREVAEAMAIACRRKFSSDVAVATVAWVRCMSGKSSGSRRVLHFLLPSISTVL